MPDKHVVRIVVVIAITLLAWVGIDAYRDARLAEIERDREIEVQIQETERTEERSQFWQKIVPWGDDEDEENK